MTGLVMLSVLAAAVSVGWDWGRPPVAPQVTEDQIDWRRR